MLESSFTPSEPILFEGAKLATSEEYHSEVTLHFCEDERSLSLLSEFEPLSSSLEKVVLDHDRDSTMLSHDESLEMENRWAMEFCEAPTQESDEKDSTDEHGTIIFETPCSFSATPESAMVLFCKTFRTLVVDVYVYRKHYRFRGCTVAPIL